ncbi:MAG TPA: SRPBCC family protein [Solirubrobacterales bacterium]
MGPISAETTIDAPRERVWAVLRDLANRPAFCDHFQHDFRLERLESAGVGASARFRLEGPRMKIWMETVIEEAEEPQRIFERGQGGRLDRIPSATVWELAEGAGRTTEAKVTFWTEPSNPIDKLRENGRSRRWIRRQWAHALERLKGLAETDSAIEPVGVAGIDPGWR